MLKDYKLGIIKSKQCEEYLIVIKASLLSKLTLFRDIRYIRELKKLNNVLTLRGMVDLNYNRKGTTSLAEDFRLCGIKYSIVPYAWTKKSKRVLNKFISEHGIEAEIPDDILGELDAILVFTSQHMAEKAINHLL